MSKVNSLFDQFLSNIEPDKDAVAYAQEAHKPVRECLEKDDSFSEYVESTFLYGSYRRHTAVGDIKDVDIVVLTNFDTTDEANNPRAVLRKLKAALARCYDDPENPQYQRRSIRIDDPLPDRPEVTMTLDIIPAVAPDGDDQPLLVPDRELMVWIASHPRGHMKATSNLNKDEYSGGKFVPLVKMMKWWWKYQCEERQPDVERPKPKGFWVECLTAETFDPTQRDWADHFISVLTNISERFGGACEVPQLLDPGLPDQTIKTSMTLEEFDVFMTAVNESLERAIAARDHEDELESSVMWRDIFGDAFPLWEGSDTSESKEVAPELDESIMPAIEPLRWEKRLSKKRKVRIDAYTYFNNVRGQGLNSNGRLLPAGWHIKFVARTNVRGNYDVYWQVVNTGRHAAKENGLRGNLFQAQYKDGSPSSNPLVNWETTQYTGKHWIQCFIVQDGYCVAESKKFYVKIRNKDYPG